MTIVAKRLVDAQEVQRAYAALVSPDQVVEVRALEASKDSNARYLNTLAGYFDNSKDLIREIATIRVATGIYMTLQPCNPELIHRAYNKLVRQRERGSTSDKDIVKYSWLPIDSDPVRPAGISSTDFEHEQALAHSQRIREALGDLGWPDPIHGDSSNGSHLHYAIDLSLDDTDLVKRVLAGLAERFDEKGVHVDKALFNPSRIIKLYGTLACKGDDTPKRPHRLSRLLDIPEEIQIVPRELLEEIAVSSPAPAAQPRRLYPVPSNGHKPLESVREFLDKHSIPYREDSGKDYTKYVLINGCVFDSSHKGKDAAIIERPDSWGYKCFHDSCQSKSWRDFRLVYEPDAYDQKPQQPKNEKKPKQAAGGQDQEGAEKEEKPKEETALTKLMRIAEQAKYIKTPEGALYARVPVNGHYEVASINERGSGFRRWLIHTYKKENGIAPNSDALSLAMSGVVADAEYTEKITEVYTRVGEHNGCVYLDIGDSKWQCVEISTDGWHIITCPPIYFRRASGMLPLPLPKRGGSLDDLKKIINTKEDRDYYLIIAWLIGALHPKGPYPVLNLNGERGSAKSKTTTILRNLIDPNAAPTRNAPKDERDAAVAAQNNMVIALDNLSSMPLYLSDVLCRIATGSGFATREMYTDADERVFSSKRPIILNGIEDGLITQGDLLNRAMLVTLQPPDEYKTEEDIDALFNALHPRLLGALLDAVSTALRNRNKVRIDNPPRMADFARWVTAAESALKWERGTFLAAYVENQDNASSIITESSPVAKAILQFMEKHPADKYPDGWTGLTSSLHDELSNYDVYKLAKTAPKAANKLSGQLKRIAPSLRIQGIDIIQPRRQKAGSYVTIQRSKGVDNKPSVGVDNKPSGVDKPPSGVDKKNLSTSVLEPDLEPIYNQNIATGVDSVDKNPLLSTLHPLYSEEKKEENREGADNREFVSTPSTPMISSNGSTPSTKADVDKNFVSTPSTPAEQKFATPGFYDQGDSPYGFEVQEGITQVTFEKYATSKRVTTTSYGQGWLTWLGIHEGVITAGVVLDAYSDDKTYLFPMWDVNPVEADEAVL